MVKREKYTIYLSKAEKKNIEDFADSNGETFSGFVRREILREVKKSGK